MWDYNGGVGGPIKKDRVWFFSNYRDEGSLGTVPGIFANAEHSAIPNAVDVRRPTPRRPAQRPTAGRSEAARRPTQPTSRNKFNIFWDEQHPVQRRDVARQDDGCRQSTDEFICGASVVERVVQPDVRAGDRRLSQPVGQRVQQATWSSPVTNKLLLEAGVGTYLTRWGGRKCRATRRAISSA